MERKTERLSYEKTNKEKYNNRERERERERRLNQGKRNRYRLIIFRLKHRQLEGY